MYSQILHKASCDIVISTSFGIVRQMQRYTEVETEHQNIHIIPNTNTSTQGDLFRESFQFEL